MRGRLWAATLVTLAVAGCGGGGKDSGKSTVGPRGTTTENAPKIVHVRVDPAARDQPCDGRPGRDIPAVDIPAVHADPVVVPAQKLGDETVPGFTVPGVDVPAQRVPAQCATIDPAPAGCFGAVHVPAVTIPGVSLPGVRIPSVNAQGASAPPVTEAGVTGGAETSPAVDRPGVCAQKVRPGEYRPSVYQPSTYRRSVYRRALYRRAVYRPQVCKGSECISGVSVPGIGIDGVSVDGVAIDGRLLDGKTLPEVRSKCVDVLADEQGATAYNICADVLFAFNRARIRPQAAQALREVARSIRKRFAGRPVRVDGHTDTVGSATYNQRLSERRAAAVKQWLVGEGGLQASRVTTRGYGETQPVASNDSKAGRRRNRRVVVGVTKG